VVLINSVTTASGVAAIALTAGDKLVLDAGRHTFSARAVVASQSGNQSHPQTAALQIEPIPGSPRLQAACAKGRQ